MVIFWARCCIILFFLKKIRVALESQTLIWVPLLQAKTLKWRTTCFQVENTLKGVKVVILITIFHSFRGKKFTSTLILEWNFTTQKCVVLRFTPFTRFSIFPLVLHLESKLGLGMRPHSKCVCVGAGLLGKMICFCLIIWKVFRISYIIVLIPCDISSKVVNKGTLT